MSTVTTAHGLSTSALPLGLEDLSEAPYTADTSRTLARTYTRRGRLPSSSILVLLCRRFSPLLGAPTTERNVRPTSPSRDTPPTPPVYFSSGCSMGSNRGSDRC